MKFYIPDILKENWIINKKNILESRTEFGGRIFKFSYHPKSGEFLFATKLTHHNAMIHSFGKYPFDEYVRGIFFPEKKMAYFRMHESLDWLEQTKKMLREKGLPKKIRVGWGEKIQRELAEELRGL